MNFILPTFLDALSGVGVLMKGYIVLASTALPIVTSCVDCPHCVSLEIGCFIDHGVGEGFYTFSSF